ncbi:MFS transporter [Prauserella muralis]|uniref:Uncharacterized protein n=1 Tax=Prauserella muralis TaxID=588067 RepID=A0A2V4AHR5_9PSEU|nr:MFS transporter [Prauserella muralis]PXY19448.1 hypothetical protein BAY60_32425 [Prauserella muralis]TWE29425.1 EmrB/QacA subfamily drug resistance transporter [Prauserella muralis]
MTLGPSTPATDVQPSAHPQTVLSVVCLGQFVVLVNMMIVFVALPAIQSALGFGGSNLTWVVNSYTLTYGGFLLLGGRSADVFGHKRMFLIGLSVFLAASLLCGLAVTKEMLVGLRAAQGVGAALFSATALTIITTTFTGERERRRALATWSAVNAGSAGLGLLLGGVLTAALSWRFTFFTITAASVAVLIVAGRILPDMPRRRVHGIDIGGAVTVTAGITATVYAILSSRENGWTASSTLVAEGLSVGLLTAFVIIQLKRRVPLVRLGVFRLRTLTAANVTMFLVVGTPVTVLYLLTLHLQQILHYSAFEAALALLPASATVAAGSLATRSLLSKLDPRVLLAVSLTCVSSGATLLACFGATSRYADAILPAVIITFLGTSCAIVTLFSLATAKLPDADAGLASGLINTTTQVGSGLWLAVFSSVAAIHAGVALGGYATAMRGVALLALAGAAVVLLMLRKRHIEEIDIE